MQFTHKDHAIVQKRVTPAEAQKRETNHGVTTVRLCAGFINQLFDPHNPVASGGSP